MNLLEIKQQLIYQQQELSNRLLAIEKDFDANDSMDDVLFSIAYKTKVELSKVKQTLARIDSGQFGRCQRCGSPINAKSQELNPHQIFCTSCEDNSES